MNNFFATFEFEDARTAFHLYNVLKEDYDFTNANSHSWKILRVNSPEEFHEVYETIKNMDNILEEKSDWQKSLKGKQKTKHQKCTQKVKARVNKWPCVTMDSEAFTKNGWKKYEDLQIGQEILTYSIKNDEYEWQSIKNLHFYENADIINIRKGNTGFNIKCTPNHKWVAKKSLKDTHYSLFETSEIGSNWYIKCSSILNNSSTLDINYWHKHDTEWSSLVFDMDYTQRELWLASSIVYDGWTTKQKFRDETRTRFYAKQKFKDHSDAMQYSGILNGYYMLHKKCEYKTSKGKQILDRYNFIKKQELNCQNLIKEELPPENVWCPETENNTWLMKQNGVITITGNSAYASAQVVQCVHGNKKKKKKKKSS